MSYLRKRALKKVLRDLNKKWWVAEHEIHVKDRYYAVFSTWWGWQNDKELILELMSYHPLLFEKAPDTLRSDKEIVQEATKRAPEVFQYASFGLKRDIDFILQTLYIALEFSGFHRREEQLSLGALEYAEKHRPPEQPQGNIILKYISKSLLEDKEFMLECAKIDNTCMKDHDLCCDEKFMIEVISQQPFCLEFLASQLRQDKDFILKIIEFSKSSGPLDIALYFIADKLLDDETVGIAACKKHPQAFHCLSHRLQQILYDTFYVEDEYSDPEDSLRVEIKCRSEDVKDEQILSLGPQYGVISGGPID